ncbi:putative rhamnogalacturonan endolyase [Rosa chinensis]|uniref:rhamnogalacturonan endolyase n=1 Tax=Rosa chinensis TaxID=74649 RepID=A0A2P6PG90_ROSCH|nr:putative rhamnogalacturonan endolyase [Rosa chinensis]
MVVMDNGILQVNLSKPEGMVTGIQYKGIDNLLEVLEDETNRGYWDMVWSAPGITRKKGAFDRFHYMAISDSRQRHMPLPDDRSEKRGQALAYPEAVLLVNPVEPEFKGEVDDKYQYSVENIHNRVHGWIANDSQVGFWQITPSEEFKSGGPFKQCLTSHVGPITLAIFHSTHYSGGELILQFGSNEPWKKVFGPVFFYLNSLGDGANPFQCLWEDAKQQMNDEVERWPYDFPASKDFLSPKQRGTVSGRLLVRERYVTDDKDVPGNGTLVGLAAPGVVGSWQLECKGYQFWTKADNDGYFSIHGVRPGTYNLYAWVPGFIGDYRDVSEIVVTPDGDVDVGTLVYEPPRTGPTLWEIGVPDRTAAEFYVPDPNPKYINKLYVNTDRFRQYGLWERYAELYPDNDLVYTIGVSDYRKDFFFAQVTRKTGNNTYKGSTWQIRFNLDNVDKNTTYKLRVSLATAHVSELQVRINDPDSENDPLFTTGQIGNDNTIARHGIHGLYRLYNVVIPSAQLVDGNNTIFLTRELSVSPFQGIMYDYIRLEGPQSSNDNNNIGFSS